MDKGLLLKYEGNFPRYTSYPTAPNFSADFDSISYQNWLEQITNQNLSLYFHIPFCDQLCWYCGCFTTVTKRYEPIKSYIESLEKEIALVSKILKGKGNKISHIHFGGGSPTILAADDFLRLVTTIKNSFELEEAAQIAIEIDPRNIDEEKVSAYAKAGVNRASIGVQDFNEEVQKAINREQSFDVVKNAVDLLRKYQISAINFDLIYGLPKQTTQGVLKNIEISLKLNPARIALFSYAHVKWKKKQMRLIDEADLADSKTKIEMYDLAAKELVKSGYASVGLDHFVLPDDEMFSDYKAKKLKRNFQGYSSDKGDFIIGFGLSSIGYLSQGYVQNSLDFEEYKKLLNALKLPVKKGCEISVSDKMRKKIIDSLMCYFEVDLKAIAQEFDLAEDYFAAEILRLESLKKDGLVFFEDSVVKVNQNFPQILRVVCAAFDEYFWRDSADLQIRHSKIS